MAAETCDEEFDVGVLVVHGVGTQPRGATVREFVDPVVALLDRLGDDGRPARLVPAPKDFVGIHPPPIRQAPGTRWLVGEAWWADAFDAPDRTEVSRWLVDAASWFVYFFVARLWARSEVRGVHVVLGLLAATSAAAAVGWAAADAVPGWLWLSVAAAWIGVLAAALWRPRSSAAVVAGSVLVLWPLAALASLAMLLVWLVGLLPGSWTAKVRTYQLALAGTVGDTYALVSSPRRERAMFDAITAATEALLTQLDRKGATARPLVVTAHSQGAALLYRLLDRDPCFRQLLEDRKVTLVTHGSAILPIHVFECRRRRRGGGWAGLSGLGGLLGLVLLALSLGRLVSGALSEWTAVTAGAAFVLSALALTGALRDERRTRCRDGVEEPPEAGSTGLGHAAARIGPPAHREVAAPRRKPQRDVGTQPVCPSLPVPDGGVLRWVDLWAPWDPVPNGPLDLRRPHADPVEPFRALPDTAGSLFLPCRVANDHQPWTDHASYRTNDEDVVSRWIGEIALRADGTAPAAVEPTTGRDPVAVRRWRLLVGQCLLALQGLTLLAAGAATVARWDEIDDLGRWAMRTFPGPLRSVVDTVAATVPEAIRDALLGRSHDPVRVHGFLVAAVAALVALAVPTWAAGRWRRSESQRFLVDTAATTRIVWASLTIGLFAVALALAAAVAAGWGQGEGSDAVTVTVSLEAPERLPLHATLTFQPLGADEGHALTVDTDRRGVASLHLDPSRRYAISVRAVGGRDCTIENPRATNIRAVCKPAGALR